MRSRDLVIRNIASPYGMTMAALLLFLLRSCFRLPSTPVTYKSTI